MIYVLKGSGGLTSRPFRYAYIEIGEFVPQSLFCHILTFSPAALYGKSYIEAAKDTWALFVDRGIDALVNDSLVSMSEYCSSLKLGFLLLMYISSVDLGRICHWFDVIVIRVHIPTM